MPAFERRLVIQLPQRDAVLALSKPMQQLHELDRVKPQLEQTARRRQGVNVDIKHVGQMLAERLII